MGLATDYCVKFTVLDALELGYKVYLIEDGCRGVNIFPDDSEKAVNEMKDRGAVIISSKTCMRKDKIIFKIFPSLFGVLSVIIAHGIFKISLELSYI